MILKQKFLKIIIRISIIFSAFLALNLEVLLAKDIKIEKIILGETELEPRDIQLIEAHVVNYGKKSERLMVRLQISYPNGKNFFYGKKSMFVDADSSRSALFSYRVKKDSGGYYKVRAFVYRKGKLITKTPVTNAVEFAVLGKKMKLSKQITPSVVKLENLENDARFSLPDVLFTKINLITKNILRSETGIVEFIIKNDGGDSIKEVKWDIFLELDITGKRDNTPLISGVIPLISPGESKFFQLPFLISFEKNIGYYSLVGLIDRNKTLKESNTVNNLLKSKKLIGFFDIALIIPKNEITISSNNQVTFRWESLKLTHFHVEISVDKKFNNTDEIFRMPVGAPTPKKSISTLLGEKTITLLKAQTQKDQKLYWRVVGYKNDVPKGYSAVQSFYLDQNLEKKT